MKIKIPEGRWSRGARAGASTHPQPPAPDAHVALLHDVVEIGGHPSPGKLEAAGAAQPARMARSSLRSRAPLRTAPRSAPAPRRAGPWDGPPAAPALPHPRTARGERGLSRHAPPRPVLRRAGGPRSRKSVLRSKALRDTPSPHHRGLCGEPSKCFTPPHQARCFLQLQVAQLGITRSAPSC